MMELEDQETARQERLSEAGTMPACPMCGKPRVQRSDYIRCNPCGMNWSEGQAIDRHPLATQPIPSIETATDATVPTAESTTDGLDVGPNAA